MPTRVSELVTMIVSVSGAWLWMEMADETVDGELADGMVNAQMAAGMAGDQTSATSMTGATYENCGTIVMQSKRSRWMVVAATNAWMCPESWAENTGKSTSGMVAE